MSATTSPVLVLDGPETAAALDPIEVLAAVREALVAISLDTVSAPARIAARTPTGLLGCMPAYVPGVGLAAELVSVFDVPGADGTRGRTPTSASWRSSTTPTGARSRSWRPDDSRESAPPRPQP